MALVAAVVVGGLFLAQRPARGRAWSARFRAWPKTAAIVDQLSLTAPNPAFVESATDLLQAAGYAVDYYPGEEVSVNLYQRLPGMGYDLIVLRSHSARIEVEGPAGLAKTNDVALFTGEPIDLSTYKLAGVPPPAATAAAAKARGRLAGSGDRPAPLLDATELKGLIPVYYDPESGELPFFGLRPAFIETSLEGVFEGSTVVMMGCDGLRSETLAQAFVDRGVGTFISWSEPVSAPHTDAATERLLELMVVDGVPVAEAVAQTMEELGPDPVYGGELAYYPRSNE
jgi:hypothetical protein